MAWKRFGALALVVGATVFGTAGVAGAVTTTQAPDPAIPGDQVSLNILLGNNCAFQNPSGGLATTADVRITTPTGVVIFSQDDMAISQDEIDFLFTVPANVTEFGNYSVDILQPNTNNSLIQVTAAQGPPACAENNQAVDDEVVEVIDPAASPLISWQVALAGGLTAAAVGGGLVASRRRAALV